MKRTVKIISLILVLTVVVGCVFALSACNKNGDEHKEKLVVGLECAYIPFNFTK